LGTARSVENRQTLMGETELPTHPDGLPVGAAMPLGATHQLQERRAFDLT
jgi:hypothetical protein